MLGRGLRAAGGLGGLGAVLLLARRRQGAGRHLLQAQEDRHHLLQVQEDGPGQDCMAARGPALTDTAMAGGPCCGDLGLEVLDAAEPEEAEEQDGGVLDLAGTSPNDQGRQQAQVEKLKAAIARARDLCWVAMYESGTPGMAVAISVNGKQVWQHGFGYSDLENRLLVGTGCVMRIASISKPLTMAVLARLWEEGRVDLEAAVSQYVPEWPAKEVDGEAVELTVRQLCCHLSGVRHYDRKGEEGRGKGEFQKEEYYIKEHFETTDDAVALFKDDELLSRPGAEFHYTTHGFTLLAKVIEKVTGQPFDRYMEGQFRDLGLANTVLDRAGPLVPSRARYYVRDQNHRLKNAPYVDNSYKWAGGGFLSNVGDLIRFGSAMLYSYQQKGVPPKVQPTPSPPAKPPTDPPQPEPPSPSQSQPPGPRPVDYHPGPFAPVNKAKPVVRCLPGFLKASTVAELWRPQPGAMVPWGRGEPLGYGLGWAVRSKAKVAGFARDDGFYVSHTGGAVGASSVLLVAPRPIRDGAPLPQGVVVAILCNMQGVGLNQLAVDIAKCFDGLELEKPIKVQKIYQC